MTTMKLTQLEKESALWLRIRKEMETRLQTARERNDNNLTQQETDQLRGRIAVYKEVLSWAEDPPNIT